MQLVILSGVGAKTTRSYGCTLTALEAGNSRTRATGLAFVGLRRVADTGEVKIARHRRSGLCGSGNSRAGDVWAKGSKPPHPPGWILNLEAVDLPMETGAWLEAAGGETATRGRETSLLPSLRRQGRALRNMHGVIRVQCLRTRAPSNTTRSCMTTANRLHARVAW